MVAVMQDNEDTDNTMPGVGPLASRISNETLIDLFQVRLRREIAQRRTPSDVQDLGIQCRILCGV